MKNLLILISVGMGLIACSPSTPQTAPENQIQTQPQSLASLIIGDSDNGLLNTKILNTTAAAGIVNLQIQSTGSLSVQQISVNSPITLSGSSSCIRNYSGDSCSFQAQVPQSTSGNFIIRALSSVGSSFFSIQAQVTSSAGNITANASSLDFGTLVGNQSVVRSITLSNSHTSVVSGLSVMVADPAFNLVSNNCSSIPALGNCIIRIAFSSLLKLPNSYNSQVLILGSAISIPITLTAVVQVIPPAQNTATLISNLSSLDYGTLNFNAASPFKVLNIVNQGPAVISSLQVAAPAGFHVVGGSCSNFSLLVNQSCSIIVIEDTTMSGTNSGNLSISSVSPGAQVSVSLAGIVNPINCPLGFHGQGATCVSNVQACTIVNGVGSQSWNGTAYSSCVAISCNTNYQLSSGSCQPLSPPTIVTITKAGTGDGDIFNGSTNVCASGQTTCSFSILQGQTTILTQTANATSYLNYWNPNSNYSRAPTPLICANPYQTPDYIYDIYGTFLYQSTCSLAPVDATPIALSVDFEATPALTIVQGPGIDTYTGTSYRIYWQTNIPTTTQAFYENGNTLPGYSSTSLNPALTTSHMAQVIGVSAFEYLKNYAESTFQGQVVDTSPVSFRTLRGGYEIYIKSSGAGAASVTESADPVSATNFSPNFNVTSLTCTDMPNYCIYRVRADGATATFTVTPNQGSVFNSWTTGPCAGSTNPVCSVTVPNGPSGYQELDVQIDRSP